ncbi:hypothetical protein JRF76_10825 [Kocuria indica]|uniref:hypothetical protein n=2 Tax=Kocuria TaxID=57493 RepID=UPI0007EBF6E0|nr:hypothetical protein [Kocuria sp. UBA1838]MBN6812646.1 hypothetical protein [Kocuria indica]MBN6844336.1 hypothetical protein [Kocuria indica]OBA48189.1 hypothetical protein A5728_07100 [Kocuria sp. ICS0012]
MITVMDYLAVFVPSLGVGVVFYLVMRWLLRGDRTERNAQAQARDDAEQWYRSVREREGDKVPFGYQEDKPRQQRGLGLRNSIPIRESPEDPNSP